MLQDVYQPALHGLAVPAHIYARSEYAQSGADLRSTFQVVPINHSPEEIRAMVRDLLG